jgi:hypothetical protein
MVTALEVGDFCNIDRNDLTSPGGVTAEVPDFVIDTQPVTMGSSLVKSTLEIGMHVPRNADMFDEEFDEAPEVVVVEDLPPNESM